MRIVLSLVGLVIAAMVWNAVHPIAGIVVGLLLVGGAGWEWAWGLLSQLSPNVRKHSHEFLAAWEKQSGPMVRGRTATYPPAGSFQAWVREYERTGVSAEDWLEARLDRALGRSRMHVALFEDGRGATVELTNSGSEAHEWTWKYDPGVEHNDTTVELLARQITRLEQEMQLPPTFPDLAAESSSPAAGSERMHVSLDQDGRGVTLSLTQADDGTHNWSWDYDDGVKDSLMHTVMIQREITRIEAEMDLPLTWPHLARKPRPPAR